MRAAVMRAWKAPLTIEDIDLDEPGPREVRVRTVASGVCHSDLHVIEGSFPMPPPAVLGHEPAGIVEKVGSDVTDVARRPRDRLPLRVLRRLRLVPLRAPEPVRAARRPRVGPARRRASRRDGEPIAQFVHLAPSPSSMLVHENALVKIRAEMPLDRAALIGCGVTTGLGAALNTAQVRAGGQRGRDRLRGRRARRHPGLPHRRREPDHRRRHRGLEARAGPQLGATDAVTAADGDPVAACSR